MNNEGRFGPYGGQYITETLMNAVLELDEAYKKYKDDPSFKDELRALYRDYAGRPSLLTYAEKMTTKRRPVQMPMRSTVSTMRSVRPMMRPRVRPVPAAASFASFFLFRFWNRSLIKSFHLRQTGILLLYTASAKESMKKE